MNAARIIYPPMSGRDRRHFSAELKKGEQAYQTASRGAAAAHQEADRALARAHRLDCEAWTYLQFIGGADAPSPTIAAALHGGCELLEVRCRHCNHTELVDLTLSIWPRANQVHTLRAVLYCRPCHKSGGRKHRPELVGFRIRENPGPAAPAMRARG